MRSAKEFLQCLCLLLLRCLPAGAVYYLDYMTTVGHHQIVIRYVTGPAICQDPKKIRDPGSPGFRIRYLTGSWNLYFHFFVGSLWSWTLSRQYCRGILGIFYIVMDPTLLFHHGIPEILDPKLLFGPGILAKWFCHGILYFATLCHVAPRHRARLDMVWIWYQLLPNPTMCHLHANTHPCGSCTRNVHFVLRSNRSKIFIVFVF